MSRESHDRVHGPYAHGNQWRVVVVAADGSRSFAAESVGGPSSFATKEAALAYVQTFRELKFPDRPMARGRTVGEAVRDWMAYQSEYAGHRKTSRDTATHKLEALLRLTESDFRLCELDARKARKLLRRRESEVAYDTLRGERSYASRLCQWCTKRGWMRCDPFADVELKRPRDRKVGKPQLRVDEARRFLATVRADASIEATGVLLATLTGLRAHEVVQRTVRDLDDGGRALVIGKSKTRAGERIIAVPAELRERLRAR